MSLWKKAILHKCDFEFQLSVTNEVTQIMWFKLKENCKL